MITELELRKVMTPEQQLIWDKMTPEQRGGFMAIIDTIEKDAEKKRKIGVFQGIAIGILGTLMFKEAPKFFK